MKLEYINLVKEKTGNNRDCTLEVESDIDADLVLIHWLKVDDTKRGGRLTFEA